MLELRLLVEQAGPNLDWRAINQRFARSRRSADLGFCLLQAQRLVGLSPRQAPISFRARLWARLDHHGALPTPHFRLAFAYGFGLLGRATAAGLQHFYVCSLSARSVIYKGMMLAQALADFYPDLGDPRVEADHDRRAACAAAQCQRLVVI